MQDRRCAGSAPRRHLWPLRLPARVRDPRRGTRNRTRQVPHPAPSTTRRRAATNRGGWRDRARRAATARRDHHFGEEIRLRSWRNCGAGASRTVPFEAVVSAFTRSPSPHGGPPSGGSMHSPATQNCLVSPSLCRRGDADELAQPRYFSQGPVMARVMPGVWMLTNSTVPSEEKVGPVNSEYSGAAAVPMLSWLRAMA
jgi:hypothetical protein